jgi:hypothetical protein
MKEVRLVRGKVLSTSTYLRIRSDTCLESVQGRRPLSDQKRNVEKTLMRDRSKQSSSHDRSAENNIPEMGLLKRKKKSCGFSPPEKDLWIEAKKLWRGCQTARHPRPFVKGYACARMTKVEP